MEVVLAEDLHKPVSECICISHHEVVRENSATTKLRAVIDVSA